ncbi:prostate-associated microseminoprotein [Pseudophryne corroboree]|uniref:prostate-associated microseminoprotein n=1 Tax=Pseudophryne corroboree TaxID=495146 RepID=UPI0030817FC7
MLHPSPCLLLPLLLCLFLPYGQCRCYFQARAPCRYAGRSYGLGESWLRTGCQLCTCLHPVGVGCCDITQHPIDFPAWCEARYDPRTCRISVVQKANPNLPCVHSADYEWGSAGAPETESVYPTHISR